MTMSKKKKKRNRSRNYSEYQYTGRSLHYFETTYEEMQQEITSFLGSGYITMPDIIEDKLNKKNDDNAHLETTWKQSGQI